MDGKILKRSFSKSLYSNKRCMLIGVAMLYVSKKYIKNLFALCIIFLIFLLNFGIKIAITMLFPNFYYLVCFFTREVKHEFFDFKRDINVIYLMKAHMQSISFKNYEFYLILWKECCNFKKSMHKMYNNFWMFAHGTRKKKIY